MTLRKWIRYRDYIQAGRYSLLSVFFVPVLVMAACVPATVPKHLTDTPGAPVLALDGMYEASVFTVRYPSGWVAVSSPANQPAAVTLVAPDENAIIRLSTHPDLELAPNVDLPSGMRVHIEQITMSDGTVLTLMLGAPVIAWAEFAQVFEAVVESIGNP